MILLLAQFLIMSPVVNASEIMANGEAYCNELIPPVVENPVTPANLTIQTTTQCQGKSIPADELCTENVSCMALNEVINVVAKQIDPNKNFVDLSYHDKQRIVLGVIASDNKRFKDDPKNFAPTYERFNTTLVCKKVTISTATGPKKVCPAPEQCRIKNKDITVTAAEYDPKDLAEINQRATDQGTKYFPVDNSVNPTLPAK